MNFILWNWFLLVPCMPSKEHPHFMSFFHPGSGKWKRQTEQFMPWRRWTKAFYWPTDPKRTSWTSQTLLFGSKTDWPYEQLIQWLVFVFHTLFKSTQLILFLLSLVCSFPHASFSLFLSRHSCERSAEKMTFQWAFTLVEPELKLSGTNCGSLECSSVDRAFVLLYDQ